MSSPQEQPRLPFSSGSRDLFPLGRDPHRDLPPKGFVQRVETLRRHLVDDALSALNWLSGKREPAPFARNQMQDACVWRVDILQRVRSLCKLLQRLCPRSCGGSTLIASLSISKLSLPVDATGACCLLSVLPDSAERYLREPERMVKDALHCAQVMSTAPEPYFDLVLVHRRRTYLELVRLLARRGTVRFAIEPKEKVGLFAARNDDGLKQRLIVDARRSNLCFRPSPNVSLLSSEGRSNLDVEPDMMPAVWFWYLRHQRLLPQHVDARVAIGFFSSIPVTAKEVGPRHQGPIS